MKTEQKQSMAVYTLIVILIALFIFSISLMWLKHDQYHMDGTSMNWMFSGKDTNYNQYKKTLVRTNTP